VTADYAFRISGRLTPALTGALAPLKSIDASVDTLLVGPVTDRAALHGYIAHLEALGLELLELRRLPAGDGAGGHGCPACGRRADGPLLTGTATGSRSQNRMKAPSPTLTMDTTDTSARSCASDKPHSACS
jgi:hypothetical protein